MAASPAAAATRPSASRAAARSGAFGHAAAIPAISSAASRADAVVAAGDRRAHHQVEPRHPLEAIRLADTAQEARRRIERRLGVSTVECQQPDEEGVEAVRLHLGQKRLRLAGSALPTPQLGEPRERVHVAPRPQRAEFRYRRRKLLLGALPVAVPEQHVRVGRAADREHLSVREPCRDVAHAQAPLGRPLEVADQLAGIDHVAAHRLDRVRIGHLAADRGGRGSVQPPHPILDLAGADQSKAVDREREHLDVDRFDLARERDRERRLRLRRIGVVVGERELRADQRHPGGRNAWRLALYEQRGALDPARRLGRPPKCVRVVAELDREPCGGRGVAARPREAVATLMRLDRCLRIKLVTGGETRPLECLRRLLLRERVGESHPRLGPRAARERHTPVLDRPIPLLRSRGRNHSAPTSCTQGSGDLARRRQARSALRRSWASADPSVRRPRSLRSRYRRCRSARRARGRGHPTRPAWTTRRARLGA